METAFYHTPGEAWQAMYDDCREARISIQFEQYILRNDATGWRFLELFIAKLKEGVRVTMILDSVGSRGLSDSPLLAEYQEQGGIVYFYNPVAWYDFFRPWRWLPRNHNKILLVDGRIGHIGSVCFADVMRDWRDIHLRFTGELVSVIQQDFNRLMQGFMKYRRAPRLPRQKQAVKNRPFYYGTSQPHLGVNPIYRELLQRIQGARTEICLVTPYFLPTRKLLRALKGAAKRGVAVHIMVGEKTDVAVADCVSRSYMPRLLRHGVHWWLYRPPILHAKYAVIDGEWAMLGSTNLDYLSLKYNREANILIQDRDAVDYLSHEFEQDKEFCIKADWGYWKKLPLAYRVAGYAGRLFKRML